MKKPLPIESLVRWAFKQELPKERARTFLRGPTGYGTPWGAVTKTGVQGMKVDEPDVANRYGLVPDFTATTDPHPDAARIWAATRDLDGLQFDLPDDWAPLNDMGDLGEHGLQAIKQALGAVSIVDRQGVRHLRDRYQPAFLIQHCAILGAPDWDCPKPTLKTRRSADGRIRWFLREKVVTETETFEIEVDGYDARHKAPKPGAYRKEYLDPDPMKAAIARAEYEIWHAALSILAEELGDRLEAYLALPTELSVRPWEGEFAKAPRVLRDMREKQPEIGARRVATVPKAKETPKAGPVRSVPVEEYAPPARRTMRADARVSRRRAG